MSKTPRTDKEAFDITTGKPDIDGVVMANFARELEIELNEQVLLNGKGSEREYSLLGKIERLEREKLELLNNNKTEEYICVDREHGLWKRRDKTL